MKVYMGPSQAERWERICMYGGPKVGKTRLATSLPRTAKWGEPLIYVASDPGAEFCRSVLDPGRLLVVKPGPPEDGQIWDPLADYVQLATFDWRKQYPTARTIILDTGTQTSWDLIRAYADTGAVQSGHVFLGVKGQMTYHAAPDKADFGAAQRSHDFLLQHLWRQKMHVIALYQQDWVEAKNGGMDELAGGPMTVGVATIRSLPALFDSVLHLTGSPTPESKVTVWTGKHGPWAAGIRHAQMGVTGDHVQLKEDPTHFWDFYDELVSDPSVLYAEGGKR